jgi:hypothetical protein
LSQFGRCFFDSSGKPLPDVKHAPE